jgi:thioredoxin 1
MANDNIITLNEDNFDDHVSQANGPILIDFWAAWCAPCKVVAPSLDKLAEEMAGRAVVAKVDVDSNGDLANRFGIRSIPTLMVFKDGKVVDQLIGAAPKDQIQSMIERHLS